MSFGSKKNILLDSDGASVSFGSKKNIEIRWGIE